MAYFSKSAARQTPASSQAGVFGYGLIVLSLLISGCTALAPHSAPIYIEGWIRSDEPSKAGSRKFMVKLYGETQNGQLRELKSQRIEVFGLPARYTVSTPRESLWKQYWVEFRWQEQLQWQKMQYALEDTQPTSLDILFHEGKPTFIKNDK